MTGKEGLVLTGVGGMAPAEVVDFLAKWNPTHVHWDWQQEAEALSGRD